MSALAERRIIPHEELRSRAERKAGHAVEAEAWLDAGAQSQPQPSPVEEAAAEDEIAPADIQADAQPEDSAEQDEAQVEAQDEAVSQSDDDRQDQPEGAILSPETDAEVEAESAAATDADARPEHYRMLEALLFAAAEPLDEKTLASRLPEGINIRESLLGLQHEYAMRGVNLVRIGVKWTFRTASDLAWLMSKEAVVPKKLSRAAIETLAVIAYHQPVTRVEVEEIRGVAVSKGTFDVLMETGWVRPRGRRKTPGRPITYGTNDEFLSHFGLESVSDLPGIEELKGSGMLDGRLPPGFSIPMPSDDPALRDDEDPLEPGDLDLGLAPPPERVEN